ncbi:MAG: hypothetical protein ACLFUQ_05345 [Candidatus Izemoplasmataceae bacterium]
MEYYTVQSHEVAFDPVKHRYWVDRRLVASISTIVDTVYPRTMKKVDPKILEKAAERGNRLHDMIEDYERHGKKVYDAEMQSYLALKRQHQIEVKENEVLVLLFHDGVPIAAGRFDMIVFSPYIDGHGIADVKRALHLDEDRLSLQLNLYKLAYEQTYRKKIHYLKCMHIRNRYYKYLDVLVNKRFTLDAIEKYLKRHPIDYTSYFS